MENTLPFIAHHTPGRRGRAGGFTLVEVLVTVGIATILLGIGVPTFRDFVRGQQVKTATFDIGYAITFARSEAIKRNGNVVMSPAPAGWQDGWSITTGATTLSAQSAYAGLTITGPANVTFTNNGRPQSTPVAPFLISDGTTMSCATVGLGGLPNSKKGSC